MNKINIVIYLDDTGVIRNYDVLDTSCLEQSLVLIEKNTENKKVLAKCSSCFNPFEVDLFTTNFIDTIKAELKEEATDECVFDDHFNDHYSSADEDVAKEDLKVFEENLSIIPQKQEKKISEGDSDTTKTLKKVKGKRGRPRVRPIKEKRKKAEKKPDEPMVCHECGRLCATVRTLRRHVETHIVERPFSCDICKKTFRTKKSVRHHMYLHVREVKAGDKHCCTLCDPPRKFCTKSALDAHTSTHIKEKNYPCPYCHRMLKGESGVKLHIQNFHTEPSQKKYFRCDKCPYQTTQKRMLQNHQYTHVDESERPFKCSFCGKGYTNKFAALKHEKRIHTGIRSICQICGNSFGAKAELKDHMRLHTGEKPYECHICNDKFGDRKKYRNHMLAHEAQLGVVLDKSLRKFDPSFALKNPPNQ